MPVYDQPFSNHGNGGDWSFKCLGCWYWMDELPQLGCETRAFTHKVRKNHSIIITNPDGKQTLYERVIIRETDTPPF